VARAVGTSCTAEACEALYRQHSSFLSLEKVYQMEVAFVAMVRDHYNNIKVRLSQTAWRPTQNRLHFWE
jgi:hypothetical protein